MAEIDRTQLFGYADIDKIQVELEMLDFEYVEKCSDWKVLMKILDVLRSGKEGHFPEVCICFIVRFSFMVLIS